MEEILEGLKILMNYGNSNFSAEHDQVYAGSDESVESIKEDDKKKLEDLGWFIADNSWSHFC
jgi:hypothetical protein